MQGETIVAVAREFLGVRFAHQGRDAASGLDCLGLLLAVAGRVGITVAGRSPAALDRRDYGSRPDPVFLRRQLETFLAEIPVAAIEAGDVLLLNIEDRPQHLAIASDCPRTAECGMIHAYAPARKVVEHRLDARWRGSIAGVYRLAN